LKTYTDQNPKLNNFTYALVHGGRSSQNDTADDDVEANCKRYGVNHTTSLTARSGCPIRHVFG
jgi:hypothetical protein